MIVLKLLSIIPVFITINIIFITSPKSRLKAVTIRMIYEITSLM